MALRRKNLLLVVAATALTLPVAYAIGESYARWTSGIDEPRALEERDDILIYEPAVFARHVLAARPVEARAWTRDATWPINRHGYRGDEFEEAKPDGVLRIMVYGGSGAFDPVSVDLDDWPHRVERLLDQRGIRVEAINAGIPGHTALDSLGRLLTEGHRFAPDVVLLYHGWNDIKDLRRENSPLRHRRPYNPKTDPRRTPTGDLDAWLTSKSVWYGQLRDQWMTWRHGDPETAAGKDVELAAGISDSALAQFRLNVETFVDVVRNAGATPVLVHQATLVKDELSEEARATIRYDFVGLTHAALVDAYAWVDQVLVDVAERKGVALIDPRSALNGDLSAFKDHVHLSLEGSQRLAVIVADALATLLAETTREGSESNP